MKRDNFTALGNTLYSNMKKIVSDNNCPYIELGIINSDMSLITDNFPEPIPKGSYMVSLHLTSNPGMSVTSSDYHSIYLHPRPLRSGDRVLVARVGTERVVTAIITNSKNI